MGATAMWGWRVVVWTMIRPALEYFYLERYKAVFRRVRKIAKSTISFVMSVCPSTWNNSAPTGRIAWNFDIGGFLENLSRKSKFHSRLTRIIGTLHEDVSTFMIKSSWIVLKMINVSDKFVEKIKTYILCSITFFSENRLVCEKMWKNIVEPDKPQMTT